MEMSHINYVREIAGSIGFESIQANDDDLCAALNAPLTHFLWVAKNGSDADGTGSISQPFLTIEYANNYAINLLNPTVDWDEAVVIRVAPGKYEEQITSSHRRIFIRGDSGDFENWPKPVILYNTGADAAHYPIGCKEYLNLSDIQVEVDSGGVFGELVNRGLFSLCVFGGGAFIEQTTPVDLATYYNYCSFHGGKGFDLTGSIDATRFIALRRCDLWGTDTLFGSSGTGEKAVKFDKSKLGTDSTTISGGWSIQCYSTEKYDDLSRLIIDTDGFVEFFSSIITVGIHFVSDTALDKRIVSCLFARTPTGEGDVTGDVDVEFIEYTGNHQCNGVDGEVMTTDKLKQLAGGQNYYRNIHEALKSCNQDSIINLNDDVTITVPIVLPTTHRVQIDGQKKWKLTTSHATTLCTIGNDQHLSFMNMKTIEGGKNLIVAGNSADLTLINCGQYTAACNVNVQIGAGNISSFIYIVKTSIVGTSAPSVYVYGTGIWFVLDRSFLKGASGHPAIQYTADADDRSRFKNSTMVHGSGGVNRAIIGNAAHSVRIRMYGCGMNATFDTNDFVNGITNASNVVDVDIDY